MFNPKYKLPLRMKAFYIDYEISNLFTEVKCKVLHCLSDHIEYFAATTDLWATTTSHPYLSHPYLSLTVHFINKHWKQQCLDTVVLFSDHTGQNIMDAIQDIRTTKLEFGWQPGYYCYLAISKFLNIPADVMLY